MQKNKFCVEPGRVLFEGRAVGWTHTSRATGEIKAVAVLPKAKITVYGMSCKECETSLERIYSES
jgi:hypothetical protein